MSEQFPENQATNVIPQSEIIGSQKDILVDGHFNYDYLPLYEKEAAENREQGRIPNPEIATFLEEFIDKNLAEGKSGTEVARAAIGVNFHRSLEYDLSKIDAPKVKPLTIPEGFTPSKEYEHFYKEDTSVRTPPPPAWDKDEFDVALYEVLDKHRDEFESRNQLYESSTIAILEDDFSYRDVIGDEAIRAGSNSDNPEHAAQYAHELTKLILAGKGEEVFQARDDIRGRFEAIRKHVPEGVELSVFANSDSWILWDIAKQEALKHDSYNSERDEIRNFGGSALENIEYGDRSEKQTGEVRNAIARRHMGWEMHLKAFRGEDVSWLDEILDEKSRELLHKIGDEAHKGQLSSREYTDLGWGIDYALSDKSRDRYVFDNAA